MDPRPNDPATLRAVSGAARALGPDAEDAALVAGLVGDARLILLGEASHGTHEFYALRAAITRRLIEDGRVTAVALEADWPDAYRINRYVRGQDGGDALAALAGFERFPTWMWRNVVVRDFVDWLRDHNAARAPRQRVGIYGLDLYSLFSSIRAVLDYLEGVDPAAAARARYRYACFDHFGEDTQAYGYAAAFGLTATCEREAVNALLELERVATQALGCADVPGTDEFFYASQNARLVKNAEEYYRAMFQGRVSSWNLRDRHMTETLEALCGHLGEQGIAPRVAVWAHNSHLGDARATEMGWQGELNVGQLVRERFGRGALLMGFTTYTGTVIAADDWDGEARRKAVVPALAESFEALFHGAGPQHFLLDLRDAALDVLREPRLQRAIGVIYRPETERVSHYFKAALKDQFDLVVHLDETSALQPLDAAAQPASAEPPETFPTGV